MNIKDIPFIVHTCDKYEKYWNDWWYFSKNIGHENIIFVSEVKKPSFKDKIQCITTGIGEWGYRILKALEYIDSKYFFYSQEDFWAFKNMPCNQDDVNFIIENDADCLKLHGICREYRLHRISNSEKFFRLDQNSLYTMSHQVTLWKKDFFANHVKENEDPWSNEMQASRRINETKHNILLHDCWWYNAVVRKNVLQQVGKDMIEQRKKNEYT